MWHQQRLKKFFVAEFSCLFSCLSHVKNMPCVGLRSKEDEWFVEIIWTQPAVQLNQAHPSLTKIHEHEILSFRYNKVILHIIMGILKSCIVFYLTKYLDEPLGIKRVPIALSPRDIIEGKVEFLGIVKWYISSRKTRNPSKSEGSYSEVKYHLNLQTTLLHSFSVKNWIRISPNRWYPGEGTE